MNIMVTGVTGGYGSYAIEYLKEFAPDDEIYAFVRSEENAEEFRKKGFHARVGDFSDLDSMVRALEGIDRLLFVSVSIPGIQKNVVEACVKNNVEYIAYTSLYGLENEKFGLEINHRDTEELIRNSGIKYTFLRDNWYIDMMAAYFDACERLGEFIYFAGDSKLSWALKKEYAEVGACVIADGNYGEVVNLSGNPISFKDLGEALKKSSSNIRDVHEVSREKFVETLSSSEMSELALTIATIYQDYAIAGNNGEDESDPSEFEEILNRPLTPLSDAIRYVVDEKLFL